MSRFHYVGLTYDQVAFSRQQNGDNSLPDLDSETFMDKLIENFKDPLIKILCFGLGITCLLAVFGYADWIEAFGIAAAVFIATFVATYSEYKNEESFIELQKSASEIMVKVFRDNEVIEVPIVDVVVNDFILLEAGDKIPADGVFIEGSIMVNQQNLNGEAKSLFKYPTSREYLSHDETNFLDKHLLFRGTVIEDGEGVMYVRKVGTNTIYGEFMADLGDEDQRESPLQVKLSDLADKISQLGYIGATAIAISFLFKQVFIDNGFVLSKIVDYVVNIPIILNDIVTSVILAIIIIVVAVPEGLPTMIAIVLSLNMRKLLNDKVLVRKLLGIETSGSLSLLFCDKTGTLTKGVFTPQLFMSGEFDIHEKFKSIPEPQYTLLSLNLKNCSNSVVNPNGTIVGGNTTERALLQVLHKDYLVLEEGNKIIFNVPFNSQRKYTCAEVELSDSLLRKFGGITNRDNRVTFIKGAPEIILPRCDSFIDKTGSLSALDGSTLESELSEIASRGVRLIAFGMSKESLDEANFEDPPSDIVFLGVIGVSDEIREGAAQSIATCHNAGIQVVMITGDKMETAVGVAEHIGLLTSSSRQQKNSIISANEIQNMSDSQLQHILPSIRVISRATPSDKSRLVKCGQNCGFVVGMTGDGVNDSSALYNADVGFSLGSGAEVAKEASDIVILDDDFSSIIKSILYGRTIFKSIRKFIIFQSTVNLASTVIVFLGPFLGFDFPLTLTQLLWVNLVMDTLAAIAFGGGQSKDSYMKELPIGREDPIISKTMWSSIIVAGLYISLLSCIFLINDNILNYFVREKSEDSYEAFLTAFFCFFIFITNINAFNVRTERLNLIKGITRNKNFMAVVLIIFLVQISFTYLGGDFLRTVALFPNEWIFILFLSLTIIPIDMLRKKFLVPRIAYNLI